MIVFVDESGDPGFKIAKGSSKHFVMAMVIFDSDLHANASQTAKSLLDETGVKPEFKFNKCSHDIRKRFFAAVKNHKFHARAIVVNKQIIYSGALREVKDSFYKYFVRQMIEKDGGLLTNAKLVIDGSGDRAFKKEFCSYLKKRLNTAAIAKIALKDSKSDHLLQLADMVAGAMPPRPRARPRVRFQTARPSAKRLPSRRPAKRTVSRAVVLSSSNRARTAFSSSGNSSPLIAARAFSQRA
jgi:hypothetical protein